jgi:hypothetical protein
MYLCGLSNSTVVCAVYAVDPHPEISATVSAPTTSAVVCTCASKICKIGACGFPNNCHKSLLCTVEAVEPCGETTAQAAEDETDSRLSQQAKYAASIASSFV